MKKVSVIARLAKYSRQDGDCIRWTGSHNTKGYGSINAGGKTRGAHRVAYEVLVGPIPDGLYVLHHCDNPKCTNPQHLFVGTHADNMADAASKGRLSGSGSNQVLTPADVREIRALTDAGVTRAELARRFGVSRSTIIEVVNRQAWRSV
jgi:hypothetical protein